MRFVNSDEEAWELGISKHVVPGRYRVCFSSGDGFDSISQSNL